MAPLDPVSEVESLPVLYQRWADELLPEGIPRESQATCLDCAMCTGCAPETDPAFGYYNRATKCCTYFPDLPNFLAGRAALQENPGAAALRAIIENERDRRGTASLRAVQPSAKIATIYAGHHKEGFGRDPDMLCPFAIEADSETGPLCGIWQQRNSVCSTWFCKHERGLNGTRFWQALQGLFGALEWSLSWWAIHQVLEHPERAISVGPLETNRPHRMSLKPDAWRQWPGNRLDFYLRCAEAVEALSCREAIEIAGMDARLFATELATRYQILRNLDPPERLRVAPFNILRQDGNRATLQSLSCSEPLEAPALLIQLVPAFDGRPVTEVLDAIHRETRIKLDPRLVRRLYDFGILEQTP